MWALVILNRVSVCLSLGPSNNLLACLTVCRFPLSVCLPHDLSDAPSLSFAPFSLIISSPSPSVFVCLSVPSSLCLRVCLPDCLSPYLPSHTFPSVSPSLSLSLDLSACLFISMSQCLSACLSSSLSQFPHSLFPRCISK